MASAHDSRSRCSGRIFVSDGKRRSRLDDGDRNGNSDHDRGSLVSSAHRYGKCYIPLVTVGAMYPQGICDTGGNSFGLPEPAMNGQRHGWLWRHPLPYGPCDS